MMFQRVPVMVSIIGLIMMIGTAVVYIFFLVAIWRGMKALESIANTMRDIANNLKSKS